jgi:hypothetical protein
VKRTRDKIHAAGLENRCQVVEGESVPIADAYLLRHIIHDWDDEKSLAILRNIRKAMKESYDQKLWIAERKKAAYFGRNLQRFVPVGPRGQRSTPPCNVLRAIPGLCHRPAATMC